MTKRFTMRRIFGRALSAAIASVTMLMIPGATPEGDGSLIRDNSDGGRSRSAAAAAEVARGPARAGAATALAPATVPRLLDLLPESTLLAIEVRDLSARWREIRDVPAIARLQDGLLADSGLAPDDLPRLAGNQAVLALVAPEDDGDDTDLAPFPVALLRAPLPPGSLARLRAATAVGPSGSEAPGDAALAVVTRADAVWVGPAGARRGLHSIAAKRGAPFPRSPEISRRLPAGGLVRGWLNPAAIGDLLRRGAENTHAPAVELARSLVVAELDALRFAGFRRDFVAGAVQADAIFGFDTAVLPAEIVRVLASPMPAARLPQGVPDDVLLLAGFPTMPEACLAWLSHVGAHDRRGPLRNLDFWVDEFEQVSGMDLRRDLLGRFGEQGWLAVFAGDEPGTVRLGAILEAPEEEPLEQSLLALRSWLAGHVRGRALGLAVPQHRDEPRDGGAVHETSFWTPLGKIPGPVFRVGEGHLVIASDRDGLHAALDLLGTKAGWRAAPGSPQESLRLRPRALAGLLSALGGDEVGERLTGAIAELLGTVDSAGIDAWYEGDAVRLRGRVEFAR